jgi:hypothetical protein
MQEIKIPNGGLNTEDAPDYLNNTEYEESHNYRITGTSGSDEGFGVNIQGNTLIAHELPEGLSANIGVGVFKNIRKAYGIDYSSTGKHTLLEFDYDTLQLSTIFTDLDDTGGVQLFNIQPDHFFLDVKLYREEYIVMTDGISGMIYCINIARLKAGEYPDPITADDFNLLKAQPLKPIKATYINDEVKTANLIKGKLFQFRYLNEYFDLMRSSWGTISKRTVPELESTDEIGDDPRKVNGIQLETFIDSDRVQKVSIAGRYNLGDWFILKTVTKEYLTTLPTEIDLEDEVREAYDPTTGIYTFIFYNDGAYEPIPPLETDEPYDAIPRNAGTLEVIDGNVLAIADLDEGYDRPEDPNVQVSVGTTQLDLGISVTDPRDFTASMINTAPRGWGHRRQVEVIFRGDPRAGDKVTLRTDQLWGRPSTPEDFPYTANSGDNNDLDSFTTNFLNTLPNYSFVPTSGGGIPYKRKVYNSDGSISVFYITKPYFEGKGVDVVWGDVGDVNGLTKNIVKSNTSYQLTLFHFDDKGRYFPIITGSNYVANTPSYAVSEGKVPQIGWSIEGTPPEGAVSYQWGISENTKYLNTLYATALYDVDESDDEFIYLNMAFLANSAVAYDYTPTDRVILINSFDSSGEVVKWFNTPAIDLPVAGFEIKAPEVEADPIKYLLKIKKSDIIDVSDLENEILIEIYTPKNNFESVETKIFYEIGEQFDIIDGEYSVTAGTINAVDAYLKPRKFRSNVEGSNDVFAFPVEDFNFSDEYASRYWSAGRGRTYNDEVGKVRRKASIRYSEPSSIGSLTNTINKFYGARIYGDEPGETTSIYGAITKLVMSDNILVALQELKVASIPVNMAIITTQAEQDQLTISDKLLNNVRYSVGNIGTGLAKRAITVSNKGDIYFVDHNNGYPCKFGRNGLTIIDTKMSKYFHDLIKSVEPKEIILIFDDFNNELNFVITNNDGEIKVISFTSQQWEYRDSYVKTLADVTLVQPDNGTATNESGDILYTPDSGYFGDDAVSITFMDGATLITKIACIEVEEGDGEVNPFSFITLTDQTGGVLVESNEIVVAGNNVPAPISISAGGEYQINGGAWTSSAGLVSAGDVVKVRHLTSATAGDSAYSTLTIATETGTFTTVTKIPVTTPTPFTFTPVTNANLNTLQTSNGATIAGINVPVSISVVGGQYQINGGGWVSTTGTINVGDVLKLRRNSSTAYSTAVTVDVTVSSYTTSFTITTKDSIDPNPFTFTAVTNAELSTTYESNAVTLVI